MERLVREDPASGVYRNDLAKCLFDLGTVQWNTGKEADGLVNLRQSAALRKAVVAAEPGNLFYRCDLGLTLSNVALCLSRRGQLAEGLDAAREAVGQQRVAFAGAPRVAIFRKYLAGAFGRVADQALAAGNAEEAVAAAQERRDLFPDDGAQLYACACAFARAAELSGKREGGADPARGHEDLALETLARAVHANFTDADKLRKDLAWARLRGRPEFEKLLAECARSGANKTKKINHRGTEDTGKTKTEKGN
jgi:hypothetical protein